MGGLHEREGGFDKDGFLCGSYMYEGGGEGAWSFVKDNIVREKEEYK